MQAEHQAHIAFHLTGKRPGDKLESVDGLGLLPAVFARYRDLTQLRYDFPIVLTSDVAGQDSVQPLSGLVDRLLQDIAQGNDGERLRQHALRLEREIRMLAAQRAGGTLRILWDIAATRLTGHNDELLQDSLRRLRAALKFDGEVVDCDKSMPSRLLQHAWTMLRNQKARRIRKSIDNLVTRLADILAAEFVRSDEGLSAERLKAAVGSSQQDAFDFAAMSRLLTEASPKTPLPESRRRRIQWLVSVLQSQRFFPATEQANRSTNEPTPHEFVFDSCTEAVDAFRRRLPEMTEVAKALAIAELEVEGRYNGSKHDLLFEDFGAKDLAADQLALFPDYLIRVGADELPAVLKGFAIGLPAKVLVQSDDLLEPSTFDGEHLALALGTQQLASTAIGLSAVYVLQSSSASLMQLHEKIFRGLTYTGPALFNIFSGATAAASDLPSYLTAAAATESRAFPCFVYDPSAGPDLASRVEVQINPQPERDWPEQTLAYEDEGHQRMSERLPFTLIDFLACDRRYAKHFARVPRAKWNGSMAPVAEFLGRESSDVSGKVPSLLMVDRDDVLQKVIVDDKLIREARQCSEMWHALQELGGIHNSHAEKLLAEERKAWAKQAQQQQSKASANGNATPGEMPAAAVAPRPAIPEAVEAERSSDDPYIETARCSSCNECIQINAQMFAYDANKQASIVNPDAGTYRQLVEAAESCQVSVIHPGKPRNPNEAGLDELVKRAEPFI